MRPTLFFILILFPMTYHSSLQRLQQNFIPRGRKLNYAPQNKPLSGAYLFGIKSQLPKQVGQQFNRLNLHHLVTPSGLHLVSILYVLKKFLPAKVIIGCLFVFGLFIQAFGGYFALQRIIGIKIIYLLFKIDYKLIFWIYFGFDFLLGTYQDNPMSFSYSFLFIAVILHSKSWYLRLKNLYIAQLIISLNSDLSFFILSPLLNSFFSYIFVFIFPMSFIDQVFYFIGSTWKFDAIFASFHYFITWSFLGPEIQDKVFLLIIFLITRFQIRKSLFFYFIFLSIPTG